MARHALELMTTQLLSVEDVFAKLKADVVAQKLDKAHTNTSCKSKLVTLKPSSLGGAHGDERHCGHCVYAVHARGMVPAARCTEAGNRGVVKRGACKALPCLLWILSLHACSHTLADHQQESPAAIGAIMEEMNQDVEKAGLHTALPT